MLTRCLDTLQILYSESRLSPQNILDVIRMRPAFYLPSTLDKLIPDF